MLPNLQNIEHQSAITGRVGSVECRSLGALGRSLLTNTIEFSQTHDNLFPYLIINSTINIKITIF